MAVNIGPRIGIEGEKQFRDELKNINQDLRTLGSEMKRAVSAFELGEDAEKSLTEQKKILEKQIEKQRQGIEKLEKGLRDCAEEYGEADSKTQRWAQAVADANTDLNKMQKQLKDVNSGLEDLGKSAEDSSEDLGDLSGLLTKGFGVAAVVGGVKELGSALMGVVTETQEYRTIMASLENSSERAGYTAEQTSATYMQLYGVLGDQQSTANATANLQALNLSQATLTELTNGAIGAWATYGDSIPIDQMAESINLAAQQSEVSSALADAIEWAGGNVEEFQKRLSEANSTQERGRIITEELTKMGLTKAGEAWRENNQDIVAVNEATAEYDKAVARLGETLAPVAAGLINFAADGIGAVIDAFDEGIRWCKDFIGWLKQANAAPRPTGLAADSGRSRADGSFANGLEFVPFDGFLAELHYGETVLTRQEADLRRRMKRGNAAMGISDRTTRSESDTSGSAEVITIPVQVTLDGRVVGESVTTYQKTQRRANGR